MEFVNPDSVTDIEVAQNHISEFQQRIYDLENLLDDLVRSVEIAQFTKQYQVTQVFVDQTLEKLQDRLVLPEPDKVDLNLTVIEGEADQELINGIRDKVIEAQKNSAVDNA
jgi:hypothetical protein